MRLWRRSSSLVHRNGIERVEFVQQHGLEPLRHLRRVAVRAADGFADHLVDQAQFLQPPGGEAELFGRILALSADFHRIDAQPSGEITE